jgi:hypothetical protein
LSELEADGHTGRANRHCTHCCPSGVLLAVLAGHADLLLLYEGVYLLGLTGCCSAPGWIVCCPPQGCVTSACDLPSRRHACGSMHCAPFQCAWQGVSWGSACHLTSSRQLQSAGCPLPASGATHHVQACCQEHIMPLPAAGLAACSLPAKPSGPC